MSKFEQGGLRYVIYARKSTENSERQIRSIDDQIADCQKIAADLGLNVIEIIKEQKSAKEPGNRPKFSQLLRDVKAKKVDGIIAWHPDRLARNMVEAGKIIHYLDTEVLRDVRFKTFMFSNDANGKMMLGMLFVFAKHYSDDLKTKVDRGMKNNFSEGKSNGAPKHGYIRGDDGLYRPDDGSFELIRTAWDMRAEGRPLTDIVEFLHQQNYQKYSKKLQGYETANLSKSALSNMFADTFYFGKLSQAKQTVDLTAIYDFEPMINEDMFYEVQVLGSKLTRRAGKKRLVYLPLRNLIFCGVCKDARPMTPAKSTGRHKAYLYYRCVNPACTRQQRSIRAKKVFDGIDRVMRTSLDRLPPDAYEEYLKEVGIKSESAMQKLRADMASAKVVLAGHKRRQKELTNSIGRLKNSIAIDNVNSELESIIADADRQTALIKRMQERLAKSELPILTPEQFANELQKTPAKLKKARVVQKDLIVRNLFLNLYFDDEKVTDYLWKEPFATLMKIKEVQSGGASWI